MGAQVPEASGPHEARSESGGTSAVPGAPGPKEFSSVPRNVAVQRWGFLPHVAPRESGGSGDPSGGLGGGGGPGPPVWHMVEEEEEGPASGASPEAVSTAGATAPSSTQDSARKPSSWGAKGLGLWGVSSPRGLRIEKRWESGERKWGETSLRLPTHSGQRYPILSSSRHAGLKCSRYHAVPGV